MKLPLDPPFAGELRLPESGGPIFGGPCFVLGSFRGRFQGFGIFRALGFQRLRDFWGFGVSGLRGLGSPGKLSGCLRLSVEGFWASLLGALGCLGFRVAKVEGDKTKASSCVVLATLHFGHIAPNPKSLEGGVQTLGFRGSLEAVSLRRCPVSASRCPSTASNSWARASRKRRKRALGLRASTRE